MFAYINETYDLDIKKGDRIRYTGGGNIKEGTIVGTHAGNLKIEMDGDEDIGVYHPNWEIEYL